MEAKKLRNEGFVTTLGERLSYWSFFLGQNLFYALVTYVLATYLLMIGIPLAKTAAVMLVVKIWDAINDPIFGVMFDKIKFKSGRKSVPWLRIAAGIIPLTSVVLFMIPTGASETVQLWWLGIAYLLWDSAYTVGDVPAFSMVTTMTDNLNERNTLMSIGRLFSGIGMMGAMLLGNVLTSEKVGASFTTVAIILAVAGTAAMLPICIVGKERNHHPSATEENFTFKSMLKYLQGNKFLLIYFLAFCVADALNTSMHVSVFASYYLFNNSLFGLVLSALNAAPALLVALLLPRILKRIDKFKLLFTMNIVNALLGYLIYLIGWQNMPVFLVLTVVRSISMSITGTTSFMFTADCAEYGKFKTGVDAKGITFSIQTFSAKLTAAMASSLAFLVLSMFGWQSIEGALNFADIQRLGIVQPPMALQGLWVVYILVPTIGMTLSTIVYLFYKLNDKDVQVMAKCNAGEISREEADARLSRKY